MIRGYSLCLCLAAFLAVGAAPVARHVSAALDPSGAEKTEAVAPETLPPLLRGITLTEEQKAKVRDIVQSQLPAAQENLKRMLAIQQEMGRRILSPGSVEENQLESLLEQVLFLQNQLARQNLRTTLEIRSLLTPEQLAEGAKYREKLKDQRKGAEGKKK
ncbi:MAG TPA: Spy/CpxP family protein refolding chaperone [Candidatus Acidoferrales bacterium]|nr:Spy/CpxP family protein refolding chaperone [Candidatus Acidoferrales bacterium]